MIKKPDNKNYINEIFILRAVACLSVVLLHSIEVTQLDVSIINDKLNIIITIIRVLLTFGTPTFIFISILLISYSYPNGLPSNFLVRRLKLIMLPYLSMAVFYAVIVGVVESISTKEIIINIFFNILGNYHGYFVLIIFQFYLLSYFFHNYLSRKNPFVIITISLIINLFYLGVFNFSNSPIDSELVNYFWKRGHWIPFIGWVFYFTLAYYIGRNYSLFLSILDKNRRLILVATIFFAILTAILSSLELIPVSSKSYIMVFFTTSMIGTLYNIFTKIKNTPYLIMQISRYSFPIYLLHLFYLIIINKVLGILGVDWTVFKIVFLFIGSIIASMITTYLLNKLKIGKYLVGGINNIGAVSSK
ncbi:acyltransferase family protein [Psychrobacter sp. CAL346-MNA-CIBAN-0220]|uniref:acyltransferase family protein n=1 Tax=Psychrobacter sp. CAL346-MNA-CIBAN-0220 TaxID=3140457 RepID=UPI003317B335